MAIPHEFHYTQSEFQTADYCTYITTVLICPAINAASVTLGVLNLTIQGHKLGAMPFRLGCHDSLRENKMSSYTSVRKHKA